MPKLVRWDLSFDTTTIPTPPVDIQWQEVRLPDVPGLQLPTIDADPAPIGLPDVPLPSFTLRLPDVDVGTEWIDLGQVGPIRIPTGVDAYLAIDWNSVTIPLAGVTITYPVNIDLIGPSLDWGSIGPFELGSIPVPEINVGISTVNIELGEVRLPSIDIPGPTISLPDLPATELGSFRVPTGARLIGAVAVPDPTTFDLDISINLKPLTDFVMQFLPDGFVKNPTLWALTAVLDEAEQRLEGMVIPAVKNLIEGVLQIALTEETKEEVRDAARNE